MRIGLDWDGTVNAAPALFRELVSMFQDAGHEVAITTWRAAPRSTSGWERGDDLWPDMAEIFDYWGFKIPVYHCDGKAKRTIYAADIWIDDNPASVMFNLISEPRFEENPEDYNADLLTLDSPDSDPVTVTWGQLKPPNQQHVSPVNYEE